MVVAAALQVATRLAQCCFVWARMVHAPPPTPKHASQAAAASAVSAFAGRSTCKPGGFRARLQRQLKQAKQARCLVVGRGLRRGHGESPLAPSCTLSLSLSSPFFSLLMLTQGRGNTSPLATAANGQGAKAQAGSEVASPSAYARDSNAARGLAWTEFLEALCLVAAAGSEQLLTAQGRARLPVCGADADVCARDVWICDQLRPSWSQGHVGAAVLWDKAGRKMASQPPELPRKRLMLHRHATSHASQIRPGLSCGSGILMLDEKHLPWRVGQLVLWMSEREEAAREHIE